LEYEPEGLVEQVGDRLNIVESRVSGDLAKFKEFIEGRGAATGGWRGSVNEGAGVDRPGVEAAAASRGDSGKAGVSGKAVATGVAAVAAAAAAGAAVAKSDDKDSSEENGKDVEDVMIVEVDTPVVTETPATIAGTTTAPTTYPAADEAAPFTEGTDDSDANRSV